MEPNATVVLYINLDMLNYLCRLVHRVKELGQSHMQLQINNLWSTVKSLDAQQIVSMPH